MLRLIIVSCLVPAALLDTLPSQCTVRDGGSCVVDEGGCDSSPDTSSCSYTTVDNNYPEVDLLTYCNDCDEYNSNSQAGVKALTLSVEPIDNVYFLLTVEWTKSTAVPDAVEKGFKVTIRPQLQENESGSLGSFCHCITSPNVTKVQFKVKYAYDEALADCHAHTLGSNYYPTARSMVTTVATVPSYSPSYGHTNKVIHWPNNCYDISPVNYSICGPHGAESINTSFVKIQEYIITNVTYGIDLIWPHPQDVPPTVPPSSYYVKIFDNLSRFPLLKTFRVSNLTQISLEPFLINHPYTVEVISFQRCARNKECIPPSNSATVNHCGSFIGFKHMSYAPPTVTSTVISTTTSIAVMLDTTITTSTVPVIHDAPSSTFTTAPLVVTSSFITSSLITSSMTSSPVESNDTVLMVRDTSNWETVLIICISIIALVLVAVTIVVGVIMVCRYYRPKPVPEPPKVEEGKEVETASESSSFTSPPHLVPNTCIYTFLPTPPTTPPITSPVPWHRVIVIMSNRLPEADVKIVYAFIKHGLQERRIVVDIYDAGAAGCGPPLWLNRALRNCSKIICVCNRQFMEEWDGQNTEGSPVHALGILVNSHINKGKYPTELFMVTVLREGDKQFVPYYIASAVPYRIEQTDEIYRAITGEHKYEM